MRKRIKNFFVWFLIVFLVLLVLFLISNFCLFIIQINDEVVFALLALICLTICQILLILMYVGLYISVLMVTLEIRKR
jgi:uncharacterized membrane protein YhaH (DUF805 family)